MRREFVASDIFTDVMSSMSVLSGTLVGADSTSDPESLVSPPPKLLDSARGVRRASRAAIKGLTSTSQLRRARVATKGA